jgi:hypothetical protein
LIIILDFGKLNQVKGVGKKGEELKGAALIPYLIATLVNAGSREQSNLASFTHIADMSRSMGIQTFIPCFAAGRSLEIFGNLSNILESAILCPLAQVSEKETILSCLILKVPYVLSKSMTKGTPKAEFDEWNNNKFPSLKDSMLHIFYSDEQTDRIDACLLLGGTDLAMTLNETKRGFVSFKTFLERTEWTGDAGVASGQLQNIEDTITKYNSALSKSREPVALS